MYLFVFLEESTTHHFIKGVLCEGKGREEREIYKCKRSL